MEAIFVIILFVVLVMGVATASERDETISKALERKGYSMNSTESMGKHSPQRLVRATDDVSGKTTHFVVTMSNGKVVGIEEMEV